MQADAASLTIDLDLTPLLVLVQTTGSVGGRKMNRNVEC
jgi:hypothetical protein